MDRNQIILAVGAAVLVVFALTVSMVVARRNPDFPGRRLVPFFLVSAALVAGMLTLVVVFGAEDAEHVTEAATPAGEGQAAGGETAAPPAESTAPESAPAETGAAAPAGDSEAGAEVFASAGCASCHTLAAADATGAVGPNLDEAKPSFELVVDRVTNGAGAMPSFAEQLSDEQIADVAAYVVQATSG